MLQHARGYFGNQGYLKQVEHKVGQATWNHVLNCFFSRSFGRTIIPLK